MEENNTTSPSGKSTGKGLGIAGLVLGILAAIIAFIPCVGTFAVIPGIIGIILSAISMNQAGKSGSPKGLATAGLICAIVGTLIAVWQWYVLSSGVAHAVNEIQESGMMDSLNKAMDQLKTITDTLEHHQE